MIKCFAVLTILLITVGCGGGTTPNPADSPKHVAATADLTVSGQVTGRMALTSDSQCIRRPPPDQDVFELDFKATGLTTSVPLDAADAGKIWELVVDSSTAGPDAVDAALGPVAYQRTGAIYFSHMGDGNTQSSLTVGQDLRSGSLKLQLKPQPRTVRGQGQVMVTGTFACSFT